MPWNYLNITTAVPYPASWEKLARKELGGEIGPRELEWITPEGIKLKPLYTGKRTDVTHSIAYSSTSVCFLLCSISVCCSRSRRGIIAFISFWVGESKVEGEVEVVLPTMLISTFTVKVDILFRFVASVAVRLGWIVHFNVNRVDIVYTDHPVVKGWCRVICRRYRDHVSFNT